jgi:hypothetical protein
MREEQAVSQHETDGALLGQEVACVVGPRLARDPDVPADESEDSGEGEHRGRLAAAVGAEDADDLTRLGGECDIDLHDAA